jgi:membrane protein
MDTKRPSRRIRNLPAAVWGIFKTSLSQWSEDNAFRLGASLAFYTLFSLAPTLIIAIALAGLVFGEEAAKGEIQAQLRAFMGEQGAAGVEAMIEGARQPVAGTVATVVGVVVLLVGATAVFAELQSALNGVWGMEQKSGNTVLQIVWNRIISFGMVLAIGFLLLVSLAISSSLALISNMFGGEEPSLLWQTIHFFVSLGVVTLLFAAIFKILPDAQVAWRDVWIGALVTALLFELGKWLISLYLGHSAVAHAYGAAGSLVLVLFWVYYSSQILFFGAEFTQVWANRYGSRIRPAP